MDLQTISDTKTFVDFTNLSGIECLFICSFFGQTTSEQWYLTPEEVVYNAGLETERGTEVLNSLVYKGVIEIEDLFGTGIPVAYILGSPKNQQ